jgi:hypothetical protein
VRVFALVCAFVFVLLPRLARPRTAPLLEGCGGGGPGCARLTSLSLRRTFKVYGTLFAPWPVSAARSIYWCSQRRFAAWLQNAHVVPWSPDSPRIADLAEVHFGVACLAERLSSPEFCVALAIG